MPGSLGVPLYTETKSQVLALNCLNQPVVLGCGRDRQVTCISNTLVMRRIDYD